jgi:lysozyme
MAQVSKEAQVFIKSFEGLRLEAYQDAGGVWTIGYGHTGPDVVPGRVIDQLTADALFLQDLGSIAGQVENLLAHPATQGQFDALVSFAYNAGVEALHTSTLLRKFNAGDLAGAAREFGEWVHVGQEIEMGLVRRRVAEIVMFMSF